MLYGMSLLLLTVKEKYWWCVREQGTDEKTFGSTRWGFVGGWRKLHEDGLFEDWRVLWQEMPCLPVTNYGLVSPKRRIRSEVGWLYLEGGGSAGFQNIDVYQSWRRYVPEDVYLYKHRCDKLKSWRDFMICTIHHTHTHTGQSSWNPNSSALEPYQLQHGRTSACVIAQQYSSATFVSLRFHFRKENFGAHFKNVTFYVF